MLRTLIAFGFLASPAAAEIALTDARVVAAFANAKAGALYLTIEGSESPDTLIGVHSSQTMAMLHETVEEDGVMRMMPVDEVAIPSDDAVTMEPGGLHIMVMGLTPEMLEAEILPVTLIFRDAGEIEVEAEVQIGPEADHDDG